MSRYIDADAVLDRLPDDLPYKGSVRRVLMQAPTADVVEVRHGKWVSYIHPVCLSCDLYYKCSVCGECDPWQHTTRGHANYCPHCGAKMDGERREG